MCVIFPHKPVTGEVGGGDGVAEGQCTQKNKIEIMPPIHKKSTKFGFLYN